MVLSRKLNAGGRILGGLYVQDHMRRLGSVNSVTGVKTAIGEDELVELESQRLKVLGGSLYSNVDRSSRFY